MNGLDLWTKFAEVAVAKVKVKPKTEPTLEELSGEDVAQRWADAVGLLNDDSLFGPVMSPHRADLYRRLCSIHALRGRKYGDECARKVVELAEAYLTDSIDDRVLDDVLRAVVYKVFEVSHLHCDPVERMEDPMYRLWMDLRYAVRRWAMEVKR